MLTHGSRGGTDGSSALAESKLNAHVLDDFLLWEMMSLCRRMEQDS